MRAQGEKAYELMETAALWRLLCGSITKLEQPQATTPAGRQRRRLWIDADNAARELRLRGDQMRLFGP